MQSDSTEHHLQAAARVHQKLTDYLRAVEESQQAIAASQAAIVAYTRDILWVNEQQICAYEEGQDAHSPEALDISEGTHNRLRELRQQYPSEVMEQLADYIDLYEFAALPARRYRAMMITFAFHLGQVKLHIRDKLYREYRRHQALLDQARQISLEQVF
jgi:hypothetical protein